MKKKRTWELHRVFSSIQEHLGLKIGLLSGGVLLLMVLLLTLLFGIIEVPIISKLSLIQILLVVGFLVAGFSMLIISITTTLMIQRPLGRLMSAIHKAETGDLATRAKVESNDELGQVAEQFNEMLRKINGLEKNRLHVEHQLTMAKEELRYKGLLEEKAAVITNTNRRLEESIKELSILYNISQSLTSSIDPEELCNQLSEVILENMLLDDFAILLTDGDSKKLEVKSARGFEQVDQIRDLEFYFGEGVSGQAAKNRQPIYISDTRLSKDYLHYKGVKTGNGSFFSVPILTKNEVLGVINFSRQDIDAFSQQEMRMLTVIGGQVAIALENARLYAKTKELSIIDELTQVYNRRHFHKILENEFKRAQRFRRPLSLLMIDVDHFKKFNDTFGHLEGDRLLEDLAATLKNHLREIDTVARYGSEEFAIILPNTSLSNGERVGLKLNNFIKEMSENRRGTQRRKVSVSIGVSSFPNDAQYLDDLINHADIALYQAKAKGRDQVIVFEGDKKASTLRVVE